jgi:hypothetical protein
MKRSRKYSKHRRGEGRGTWGGRGGRVCGSSDHINTGEKWSGSDFFILIKYNDLHVHVFNLSSVIF